MADRIFITMTVEDTKARTKTMRRELATTDAAQAVIDEALIVAAYNAAMNSQIVKSALSLETAWVTVIPGTANVDAGATATAQLAGRPEKASTKWVDPLLSTILPGGTINLADPLVVAIQNLFVTPGNICLLSDGEAITGFVGGTLDR